MPQLTRIGNRYINPDQIAYVAHHPDDFQPSIMVTFTGGETQRFTHEGYATLLDWLSRHAQDDYPKE